MSALNIFRSKSTPAPILKCGHKMKRYKTDDSRTFKCNNCGTKMGRNMVLHGCKKCHYGLCLNCQISKDWHDKHSNNNIPSKVNKNKYKSKLGSNGFGRKLFKAKSTNHLDSLGKDLMEYGYNENILFMNIYQKATLLVNGYIRKYVNNELHLSKKTIKRLNRINKRQNIGIYMRLIKCDIPTTVSDIIAKYVEYYTFQSRILKNDEHKNMFYQMISKSIYKHSRNKSILKCLKLIYRGSRDGFKATNFHENCQNKGKMAILIWNEKNYIFGGFTARDFKEFKWYKDKYSFLFNIKRFDTNNKAIYKPIIYEVNTENDEYINAVRYQKWSLISFGITPNMFISDNSNKRYSSYIKRDNKQQTFKIPSSFEICGCNSGSTFMVNDIEVYKVYSAVL